MFKEKIQIVQKIGKRQNVKVLLNIWLIRGIEPLN